MGRKDAAAKTTNSLPSSSPSKEILRIEEDIGVDLTKELDDSEKYCSQCTKYGMPIDASVVISLKTRWHVLRPSVAYEGHLLPLLDILSFNTHVKYLDLSATPLNEVKNNGFGNSNARIIHKILLANKCIDELNLSGAGLDDVGVSEVADGICQNCCIKKLNLSRNHFSEAGSKHLLNCMSFNSSLVFLDLTSNALGFESINSLIHHPSKRHIVTEGNYVLEEILNAVSHGLGFLLSVIGGCLLLTKAYDSHFWPCFVFVLCQLVLFACSATYHSLFMFPKHMRILQILDHVGIYLMIAGTCTPYLFIGLHGSSSAKILLVIEWVLCLFGISLSVTSDMKNKYINTTELVLFLVMGFLVVVLHEEMVLLCKPAMEMALIGGLFYLAGIAFFMIGEKYPLMHTVWHMFVIAAAVIHWFGVYFYLV